MAWRNPFTRQPWPLDQTVDTDRCARQLTCDVAAEREDQLLRAITTRAWDIGLGHTRAAPVQDTTDRPVSEVSQADRDGAADGW